MFKQSCVLLLGIIVLASCSLDEDVPDNVIFNLKEHQEDILYYDIEIAETLATQHLNNRLKYFMPWGINFDNLNEDLLFEVHYDFGDYITPVGTAETAFSFNKLYLEKGDDIYLRGFKNNVNWLLENLNEENYLLYKFEWMHADSLHIDANWISSMAQGEALAAFCMAYDLLEEKVYLKAAEKVYKTLYTNTTNYWCIGLDEKNYYWQEEIPNPNHCHILNGIFFGTFGLWDYYALTGDKFALFLFEASLQSIIDNHNIWDWEGVDGSRYCLHRHQPDPNYHPIHINQLDWYADYFNIPEFYDVINEFRD